MGLWALRLTCNGGSAARAIGITGVTGTSIFSADAEGFGVTILLMDKSSIEVV
jgi:hypothetical protein